MTKKPSKLPLVKELFGMRLFVSDKNTPSIKMILQPEEWEKKAKTIRIMAAGKMFYLKPLFSIVDIATMDIKQLREVKISGKKYLKSISPFNKRKI